MTKSESIAALSAALTQCQSAIVPPKKDAANPFFHSKYATLDGVWDVCREPLKKNDLAVMQLPGKDEHGTYVETVLSHKSGEWVSSKCYMTPTKDDPQGVGSLITYARRYGLQAMLGIAPEDDDGNAASAPQTRQDAPKTHPSSHKAQWAEPVETKPFTGDWREVVWPIPPLKGTKLGDFTDKDLKYWQDKFVPKPYKGKISQKDLDLRAALDASMGKGWELREGGCLHFDGEKSPKSKYNGEQHEALSVRLAWDDISQDDFIAAMKEAKQLPESAKHFAKMTEETAAKFMEDIDATIEITRNWIANRG